MVVVDDVETLRVLHARLVDTNEVFENGIAETDDIALRTFVERFHRLHARHIDELDALMRLRAMEPQEDGSWLAWVQKGVNKLRSTFGMLDARLKSEIIDCERNILSLYDDALEEAGGELETRDMLVGHKREIRAAIASSS